MTNQTRILLLLIAAFLAACGESRTGAEGGPCYGNGTCDGDLVCTFGSCQQPVDLGPDGGPGDGDGDGDGDDDDDVVDGACDDGAVQCQLGDVHACEDGAWVMVEDCGDGLCDDGACVEDAGDCATTCGVGSECDGQDCGDGGSCYFGTCLEVSDCYLDEGWCTNAFSISPGFVGCSSTELGVSNRSAASYCSGPGTTTDIGLLAPEQVWGFLPQQSGMRTVTVIPLTDWDVGLYVTSGHCLPSFQCFKEVDQAGPGEPETISFFAAEGGSYAVFVDGVRDGTVGGGTVSGPYVIAME